MRRDVFAQFPRLHGIALRSQLVEELVADKVDLSQIRRAGALAVQIPLLDFFACVGIAFDSKAGDQFDRGVISLGEAVAGGEVGRVNRWRSHGDCLYQLILWSSFQRVLWSFHSSRLIVPCDAGPASRQLRAAPVRVMEEIVFCSFFPTSGIAPTTNDNGRVGAYREAYVRMYP